MHNRQDVTAKTPVKGLANALVKQPQCSAQKGASVVPAKEILARISLPISPDRLSLQQQFRDMEVRNRVYYL